MAAHTAISNPYDAALLKRFAVALATLTGYTNADVPGGFEVYVTSAAACVVTPHGGGSDITLTPAAGVLPYRIPFRCSAVVATSVATSVVVF